MSSTILQIRTKYKETKMATMRSSVPFALCLVLMLFGAPACAIDAITATTDVWIRSAAPDTTYENDDVSIRGSGSDTRFGVIEFDLSGVAPFALGNATSLVLTSSSSFTTELSQTAFRIDTTAGTAASALTWSTYQSEYAGNEIYTYETLGVSSTGGPLQDGQKFPSFASANDLADLQSVLNSGGLLTLILKPLDSSSDVNWDDDDTNYGSGLRAVLNLAGDLGDFNNSGTVDVVDFGILRDHFQAHLDGPVTYENGDIDFDGDIDLDDFGKFKSIYPGGASALQAALGSVVPEPSGVLLGISGLAGMLVISLRSPRRGRHGITR